METLTHENALKEQVDTIIKNTSALREVTYSYIDLKNECFFNETIFIKYLGLPETLKNVDTLYLYMQEMAHSDQVFFEEIKFKTEEKLDEDISVLEEYLQSGECDDSSSIELLIVALKFTKNGLDFELEAAGYIYGLSQEEELEKTKKQFEYDAELFGEHVSENPEFLRDTYAYLQYLEDKHGAKISKDKRLKFSRFKEKIREKLQGNSDEEVTFPQHVPNKKDSKFLALKSIKIPREDYTKILDGFFAVAGVEQRSEIGNYGSLTDSDDKFGVPNSLTNPVYTHKTGEELLRLGPHEATHYRNLMETQENKRNKRPGDMLKEEGLAMLVENLIAGVSIENMSYMTFAGPSVVMGSLLSGEEFFEFQGIYDELLVEEGEIPSIGDTRSKTMRKMRGFSKNSPGGTNKDSTYALGLKMVLEHIRGGGSIADLFGGKISIEDVSSGDYRPKDFGNKYINHIILAELILFYLEQKEEEGNVGKKRNDVFRGDFQKNFIIRVKEKYKGLGANLDLFDEIGGFVFSQKRKLLEIINIIEKHNN